jgi:spore coat polysaccharide biosynthesis predicted glycosyltransferase SpsG
MNFSFIIKASTEIGYGHLIRSKTLASSIQELKHESDRVFYYVIGNKTLDGLLFNVCFNYKIFKSEEELFSQREKLFLDGIVIFDLLSVGDKLFNLANSSSCIVSLSPFFNHMDKVETIFHRTKYHNYLFNKKTTVHKGLEYALIQEGCEQIDTASYKKYLNEDRMSIAVSMGGGDAANKTLKVIKQLNKLKNKYVVWIMLGHGYKHSYDELIEETKKSYHEIILAKTNSSMWKILSLNSLLILPGGITTYESVYAGLPTINFVENPSQRFLIQELVENNLCDKVNNIDSEELTEKIEYYNKNRRELFIMHLNSKGVIDGLASNRIYEIMIKGRCHYGRNC